MLLTEPFRWTDGYVWFGFILGTWLVPARRWSRLNNNYSTAWPVADGRIDSVEVFKPTFSFTTKRGYYVAELGYSYVVRGTAYSGHYKRDFPSQGDADEFVRDLQGKAVIVRYQPRLHSRADIDVILRNRQAAPLDAYAHGSIPNSLRPLIWIFSCFSVVGLVLGLWVHLGALMGKCVAPQPLFLLLHVGIFVVWLPAILAIVRLVGMVDVRELLTVALKNSPDWMRYTVYGFGAYAFVNFFIFMTQVPKGGSENPPAIVWRGFSGHWMAFYTAAFAMLYSAANADNPLLRCANGHLTSSNSTHCLQCGQPVVRTR